MCASVAPVVPRTFHLFPQRLQLVEALTGAHELVHSVEDLRQAGLVPPLLERGLLLQFCRHPLAAELRDFRAAVAVKHPKDVAVFLQHLCNVSILLQVHDGVQAVRPHASQFCCG
jgi:hypothetical protein